MMMATTTRQEIAIHILKRLEANAKGAKQAYHSGQKIKSCIIEDLLPIDLATLVYNSFPRKEEMMLKKSLRENKYVAAQMNKHNPILEEAIYAFQDSRIIGVIADITGLKDLRPDAKLYAGGVSLMAKDNFLNPHVDNSHDKDRNLYRVLNLLYYVTPDWRVEYGGNLELWDNGPKNQQRTLHSKFNRLIVMATDRGSWHSVSQVLHDGSRCCVSNYYFSSYSPEEQEYFHVTSFRGRPEEKLRDTVLQADAALRMSIRKVFKKGIVENPHVYKKD